MQTQQGTRQDRTGDDGGAPFHDGVAIGLFAVVASTLAVMVAVGEVLPEPLVFCVVLAGLGVAALRTRSTALRWVIAGLTTVFVGINLVFALGDLRHPESPAPFVASAAVVLCGVVTVVLALFAARRRALPALKVWPAVAGVLALVAVGGIVAGAQVEDDVAQPGDTTAVAEDFAFPDELDVDAGTGLLVENADRARHTFVIDGEVDTVELPASSDVRVDLSDLDPGTYRYYCDVAGHEDMEGTITVG